MDHTTKTQKILVIDDEESYRQIISMTLQMTGYEVLEATNGLDGLAAAKMHHPDLILCDVNMPKMDGHALLAALRNEQEFAGIPFVFLTGNAGPGDLRKGMQAGADDYLTKPFSAEELINAVATRITKKRTIQKYFESQFDDIRSNIALSLPHEFRTPLNGILGFSQILAEEEDVAPEEVRQIGSMINKSGKRLHHLLENLVLFGQLQLWRTDAAKTSALRKERSGRVGDTLQAIIDDLMVKHERPGSIISTFAEAEARISAQYLGKIVEEVTDNALKFSDRGTTVSVDAVANGTTLTITVRDAGRGMTEEQVGRISGFQQFERGYYEQQGAGLGLALTRALTEIHDGTLSIVSEKNLGTTVTIALPSNP
ncbi:MAG: response regulator [Bacteroidetes bacterium]|nr:response regulator [Bacteroidota bacterium]